MLLRDPNSSVRTFLSRADISIDGNRPWDIQVRDPRFFERVLQGGSLGFGESYLDGDWECDALDEMFRRLALVPKKGRKGNLEKYLFKTQHAFLNLQSKRRAHQVVDAHYDLSNVLFENMLDPYMQYSCAHWQGTQDLNEAQIRKMDLICRKLELKPGLRVLEIGCGWGGFASYMASTYGCHVTAVNISKEQIKVAREKCRDLPVNIVEKDYRDVDGVYDRVVSIAMFEAVGPKNYRQFMEVAARSLKKDGLFLLHTIGENKTRLHGDPWILRYVFPNGHIPSIAQIGTAMEGLFVMEDWHNLSTDYDRTLMAWEERFVNNWEKIRADDPRFDERFFRLWRYYLLNCAGAFRARNLQLWQIVGSLHRSGRHYTRVV